MEDRLTTSALYGGMQLGNNNCIIYRNCAITYITNITNNCTRCHPAEEHDVSEDTPRDLVPNSSGHTTTSVRIVDYDGRELELGDLVEADRSLSVHEGDGMIIGLDEMTRKIVHKPINVEERFLSFPLEGANFEYSPIQVVQRAKGMVGQKYHYGPVDFVSWCWTDMTLEERIVHKGLQDTNPAVIAFRIANAWH